MSYVYHYTNGEANFGSPIESEVKGGAHLTLDIILHDWSGVFGLRRPNGLHDGPKNELYFPHGLIRFGESVLEAARRLAVEQGGAEVDSIELYTLPSWVENDHWHLCLNVFAHVASPPVVADEISEVVYVTTADQGSDFAWWTREQLGDMLTTLGRRASY